MSNDNEVQHDIEDVKLEEEALKDTPEAELKKEILSKFGLNEEEHAEMIAKLLADKMEERKKLGTAIKQKRNWREKFNSVKPEEKKEVKTETKTELSQTDIDALVEKKLAEKLDSREIDSTELTDALKTEVKNYATLNKVSIKEALKSDYIQFQINKAKEAAEIDDASISNKHDKTKSNKNFKDMTPDDFDVSTEEGRKDWNAYKKYLASSK